MKDVIISIFSGIIGVLLTIGYQHFFAPSQSFSFFIEDKEVVVTQSEYMELAEQNEKIKKDFNDLQSQYEKMKENEINNKEIVRNLQLENDQIQNKNIQLQDDIENFKSELANLQNESEQYRERYGSLNMDTDNENETVSIINLETFQGSETWWNSSDNSMFPGNNNFIDTYGKEYPNSHLAQHFHLNDKDKHAPTYLLDGNYSKCEGKIAWPKSDKNEEGSVWIDFYSENELIYQTEPMSASDRALSFEFNVEGIEKLTIVKKATSQTGIIYIIYPYFNLI